MSKTIIQQPASVAEAESKAGFAAPTDYSHSHVALEGKLELERLKAIPPVMCDRHCQPDQSFLCGWAKRKSGATSLHALDSLLEHLNGKEVRVTVEWL